MIINIGTPLSFSEIGQKDNQEDYIKCTDSRCFVLCDGMGGHANGEVASRVVAEALIASIAESHALTAEDIRNDFQLAIQRAYDTLDAADTSEENQKKMGTTMTAVVLGKWGALVAHIGDSRIYQVRPSLAVEGRNGIVYQTCDHSLVNDLLRAGELTEEEARDFPRKNVITRAMQPHQERRSKADMDIITDIKAGDYFFMCCDGVLERLTNDELGRILSSSSSDPGKIAAIKAVCDQGTRDNYTCWLIPVENVICEEMDVKETVEEVDVIVETVEAPLEVEVAETETPKLQSSKTLVSAPSRKNTFLTAIFPIICVMLVLAGASWFYTQKQNPKFTVLPSIFKMHSPDSSSSSSELQPATKATPSTATSPDKSSATPNTSASNDAKEKNGKVVDEPAEDTPKKEEADKKDPQQPKHTSSSESSESQAKPEATPKVHSSEINKFKK